MRGDLQAWAHQLPMHLEVLGTPPMSVQTANQSESITWVCNSKTGAWVIVAFCGGQSLQNIVENLASACTVQGRISRTFGVRGPLLGVFFTARATASASSSASFRASAFFLAASSRCFACNKFFTVLGLLFCNSSGLLPAVLRSSLAVTCSSFLA